MKHAARDEFIQTLSAARLQGKWAMQALAEDHLPLVAAMVRRFPWHGREKEELYQQGCVGLMKALARYDPAYGTAFSTYAAAMILGEMRMLCRLDAPIHVPRQERELRSRIRRAQTRLAQALKRDPTVDELASLLRMDAGELMLAMEEISVVSSDTKATGCNRSMAELLPDPDRWETRILLRDLLERLDPQDRQLMLLRYHLGNTQAETARHLGMTQVQVSRREAAVKQLLRQLWTEDS